MSNSVLKAVAGVVALGAIAFGASAIAGASSSGSGGGGSAAFGGPRGGGMPGRPPGAYGMPPGAGGAPGANGVPNGSPGANGTPPPGAHGGPPPGFGQPVTGATAAKVKAAALARYAGTIEHIFALPGGRGYVAHVFRSNGSEVHVLVSPRFRVIGVDEGPGGPPPAAGAAKPNGSST